MDFLKKNKEIKKPVLMGRFEYNSPVILTFALICVAAYIINAITAGRLNSELLTCYPRSGIGIKPLLRSFLYIFGHAGLRHLTGNMTLFLLLCPIVEEKYGSGNLIIMIFSTAFITALVNNIFTTGIIGASGIVFMLIILSAFTSQKSDKIPISLILVFLIYVGGEIVTGLTAHDNVSQFGHIAGGFCGLGWGMVFKRTSG